MKSTHTIKRSPLQDRASRLPGRLGLLIIIILIGFGYTETVFAQETAEENTRLHITVGYSRIHYHDMVETVTRSPLQLLTGPDKGDWEREWEENRFTATLAYDALSLRCFQVTPHFEVGVSQGRFRASNHGIGFTETWDTTLGPLLGGGLTAEVRTGPTGPFFEARYAFLIGWSREDTEHIVNLSAPSQTGADRTAVFWHRTHRIRALAGWRERMWSLGLGIQWTDFELRKTLSYAMAPRSGSATDLLAASLLNSNDSVFHYANRSPVRPCIQLTFSPLSSFTLQFQTIIASDQEYSALLEYHF